jgi:hypothetical protein
MEEHFVLVVQHDNVVKFTFHLAQLVQGHQIAWIPHNLLTFHKKNTRTIDFIKRLMYNNVIGFHLKGYIMKFNINCKCDMMKTSNTHKGFTPPSKGTVIVVC